MSRWPMRLLGCYKITLMGIERQRCVLLIPLEGNSAGFAPLSFLHMRGFEYPHAHASNQVVRAVGALVPPSSTPGQHSGGELKPLRATSLHCALLSKLNLHLPPSKV